MKDVIGYEGIYQVSTDGKIFSVKRQLFLKQFIDHKGYYFVCLWKDGKSSSKTVHRLVANAYLPIVYGKPYVNHIDSNKLNNSVVNLEWCTARDNMLHSYKNGRKPNSGNAKLKPNDVLAIRAAYTNGESAYSIAKRLSLKWDTVSNIVKGRSWQSV